MLAGEKLPRVKLRIVRTSPFGTIHSSPESPRMWVVRNDTRSTTPLTFLSPISTLSPRTNWSSNSNTIPPRKSLIKGRAAIPIPALNRPSAVISALGCTNIARMISSVTSTASPFKSEPTR